MDHGGKRAGAGRKPGAATQKTRLIADRATAEGITPLEVMLEAMRSLHAGGALVQAAGLAKDAAPYMHARLSAVTMDATLSDADVTTLTDEQLAARIAHLESVSVH